MVEKQLTWQRSEVVGGLELFLSEHPAPGTVQALEQDGWQWSPSLGCWFNRDTPENLQSAVRFCELAHSGAGERSRQADDRADGTR